MDAAQHINAFARSVLLDAGAEAEMRSFGVEQHGGEASIAKMLSQRFVERRDHFRVDNIRLWTAQAQAQKPAFHLKPDLEWGRCHQRAFGWMLLMSSSDQGVLAASARRSVTKSTSRPVSFVPSLKARKPARASVIMLSASQAREFSLLRFHASSLGLRNSSIVFAVQSGKV